MIGNPLKNVKSSEELLIIPSHLLNIIYLSLEDIDTKNIVQVHTNVPTFLPEIRKLLKKAKFAVKNDLVAVCNNIAKIIPSIWRYLKFILISLPLPNITDFNFNTLLKTAGYDKFKGVARFWTKNLAKQIEIINDFYQKAARIMTQISFTVLQTQSNNKEILFGILTYQNFLEQGLDDVYATENKILLKEFTSWYAKQISLANINFKLIKETIQYKEFDYNHILYDHLEWLINILTNNPFSILFTWHTQFRIIYPWVYDGIMPMFEPNKLNMNVLETFNKKESNIQTPIEKIKRVFENMDKYRNYKKLDFKNDIPKIAKVMTECFSEGENVTDLNIITNIIEKYTGYDIVTLLSLLDFSEDWLLQQFELNTLDKVGGITDLFGLLRKKKFKDFREQIKHQQQKLTKLYGILIKYSEMYNFPLDDSLWFDEVTVLYQNNIVEIMENETDLKTTINKKAKQIFLFHNKNIDENVWETFEHHLFDYIKHGYLLEKLNKEYETLRPSENLGKDLAGLQETILNLGDKYEKKRNEAIAIIVEHYVNDVGNEVDKVLERTTQWYQSTGNSLRNTPKRFYMVALKQDEFFVELKTLELIETYCDIIDEMSRIKDEIEAVNRQRNKNINWYNGAKKVLLWILIIAFGFVMYKMLYFGFEKIYYYTGMHLPSCSEPKFTTTPSPIPTTPFNQFTTSTDTGGQDDFSPNLDPIPLIIKPKPGINCRQYDNSGVYSLISNWLPAFLGVKMDRLLSYAEMSGLVSPTLETILPFNRIFRALQTGDYTGLTFALFFYKTLLSMGVHTTNIVYGGANWLTLYLISAFEDSEELKFAKSSEIAWSETHQYIENAGKEIFFTHLAFRAAQSEANLVLYMGGLDYLQKSVKMGLSLYGGVTGKGMLVYQSLSSSTPKIELLEEEKQQKFKSLVDKSKSDVLLLPRSKPSYNNILHNSNQNNNNADLTQRQLIPYSEPKYAPKIEEQGGDEIINKIMRKK